VENGTTRLERSEAFYFDNAGPEVTLISILESEANDKETGL